MINSVILVFEGSRGIVLGQSDIFIVQSGNASSSRTVLLQGSQDSDPEQSGIFSRAVRILF